MNKSMQPLTAAALAFALLAPTAWAGANDHATHQKAQSGEMQNMPHGQVDHSQMKNMDHSQMDHGAMHKDAKPKTEGSDDR